MHFKIMRWLLYLTTIEQILKWILMRHEIWKINKWQFWDHSTMKIPRGNEDIKNANVNLRNHIWVDTHTRVYARKLLMHDEHCFFKWKKIVFATYIGMLRQDSNFRFKCKIKNLCSPPPNKLSLLIHFSL